MGSARGLLSLKALSPRVVNNEQRQRRGGRETEQWVQDLKMEDGGRGGERLK